MEKKNILIVGAGISGLSLAINLKKLDIPFRIIEKQENWEKKGLAMSIQGEGLEAASLMGILKEIKVHGEKRNLQRIENIKGKKIIQIKQNPEDQSFVIRRDILHEALRLRVPEIEMGLSVVNSNETKSSQNITFSDGSSSNFSLVVGADGINSEISKLITKKNTIYSGSVLWGITIIKKYKDIIEVWNKNSIVAFYPIENGTVFSFFRKAKKTFSSSRLERKDHIIKYFSNYPQPAIKEVLNNLPENIFFDHVRYTRPGKWNKGRITLIGDACHSLSPLSGLGANIAMADAVGLANIIHKYGGNDNFPNILEKYNLERKEKADKALYLSKFRTKRGMLSFPENILRDIKINHSGWKY